MHTVGIEAQRKGTPISGLGSHTRLTQNSIVDRRSKEETAFAVSMARQFPEEEYAVRIMAM